MYDAHTHTQTAIDDTSLSANVDAPEGGFDALIQIAACTDVSCHSYATRITACVCVQVIGWRDDALRLVFHFTDNEYHIAGDGRVRTEAGGYLRAMTPPPPPAAGRYSASQRWPVPLAASGHRNGRGQL